MFHVSQMKISSLYRSCLFVPADRMGALSKAFGLRGLDCMVIDMEDACAATDAAKQLARTNVATFLEDVRSSIKASSPKIVIRVNCPLTTSWGNVDLKELKDEKLIDSILLPKAESVKDIEDIGKMVHSPLMCMVETARGVQKVDEIVDVDKVQGLVFGSNDLSKDINATLTQHREPLLYSMSRTILAAKASDKVVIDGVFMSLAEGFEADLTSQCIQGKELGFDGKSLIHPKQVLITNQVFSPSREEVEYARRLIEAYDECLAQGKGVALLDGKLIEQLHADAARKVIEIDAHIQSKNE